MPMPSRVPGDENRLHYRNRALVVIAVIVVLSAAISAQQSSSSQLRPYTVTLATVDGQRTMTAKNFANIRFSRLDEIRSACRLLIVALTTTVPRAHERAILPDNFWTAWSWEPPVLASLIFSLGIYLIGVRRLWRRSTPERSFAKWRVVCFLNGWLVLVLAFVSPLHALAETLFSAHMAQHELLMMIAAPLLVLSRPLVPMLMALPPRSRMLLGAYTRRPGFSRARAAATNPIAAWLIYGIALWIWHLPALYQATLQSNSVHAFQHTFLLGTAILFWWTLIHGRYGKMGYGAAVIYLFTTAVHSGGLGALFTFSNRLWYPAYLGRAAAWHLTAIQDQQLGGLIIWVPAGVVLIGTSLGFLAAMRRKSGRRASYSILADVQNRVAGGSSSG